MADSFDLVVIGAGSGGVAASRRAAAHGAKVAIIESSRVGGTCVIRGCVPKKLLMYAAAYGDGFREAAGYGWNVGHPHFEMPRWAAAKAAETQRLEHIYRQLLAGSKVELIEGRGVIDGPQRVRVGERVLNAKHILIATGAAPVRDSIPGIEHCPTSDDLLDLHVLPQKAAVIGGGFIALEFASMLARLGVAVSLFYRARLPLRGFDEDLRTRAAAALQAAGVELHPGVTPREVQRAGGEWLLISADERMREYPFVLNATGRRPNTAGLGLESLGITLDDVGAVPVDARLHTTADGVYAIGDVTNKWNLTPVAIAEGRALADSLFGADAARGRPEPGHGRGVHAAAAGHHRADRSRRTGRRPQAQGLRGRLPADAPGLHRRRRALLHEAAGRRPDRQGAGGAHAGRRCARDRAEPGRGAECRRHQGDVRPHDRRASHGGGRIRADARAVARGRLTQPSCIRIPATVIGA